MYITEDNSLYSFGFNEYGQLGDGTTKNKTSPEFIMSDIKKAEISDTHTMIVDKYGTLYAAGDNSYSQLGTKNAVSSTDFIKIMQGVKDIKVGNYLSLVLSVNGELYTAGINDLGQLGNNGENYRAEMILALTGVEKISLKNNTCAALTYSGDLYVWGDNKNGKAGVDSSEFVNTPNKISENVYDFVLSDNGILIIDNNRNISVNKSGVTESILTFDATIPEAFKSRFPNIETVGNQSV
jgi:alpha-tubulin suppressor-like RCC1 family protein